MKIRDFSRIWSGFFLLQVKKFHIQKYGLRFSTFTCLIRLLLKTNILHKCIFAIWGEYVEWIFVCSINKVKFP